jgi:sn-glycerol 3-phosphate transport system substrate-binding protein
MTAALFAIRTAKHPAIVQVNEVATATMMAAKGATYPVYQLMREQGRGVRSRRLPAGRVGLLHRRERQHAVVPVQRLDADPLLQQGPVPRGRARPEAPPRTWPEVEAAARKLLAAGVPCGFTTAWPSWINCRETCWLCTTSRSRPGRTASAGSTPSW